MTKTVYLSPAQVKKLLQLWVDESGKISGKCHICGEIEISTQEKVFLYLKKFVFRLQAGSFSVYSCPECGQLFEYTSWMESPDWGECMEGMTEPYEVDALYRRDFQTLMNALFPKGSKAKKEVCLLAFGGK